MSIIIKGITKAQFYKDTNKIPYMDVGWDIEELPPHGRLIDADALMLRVNMHGTNKFGMLDDDIREFINAAPTIIEAEEAEQ